MLIEYLTDFNIDYMVTRYKAESQYTSNTNVKLKSQKTGCRVLQRINEV